MANRDTDESEFSAYFEASYDRVRRVAYLMTGDWRRADDLAQSAFARLARSWRTIWARGAVDDAVRSYVFRQVIDDARRPWRRDRAVAGTHAVDDDSERFAVAAALSTLPPRQRAVVVCRFYEDLDVAATAALLGCSPGTVTNQTARALDALSSALDPAAVINGEGA